MRILRANLPKLSQYHVCSECFKSCCNLNLWPGRKRKSELNEDAVPSIFPHQQKKSRRLASERIRLDLSHNPSSFDTIPHKLCCPELIHVRSDVTKWRWVFLSWEKPEEKMSKMADVQFQKITTRFGLCSKGKNLLLSLLTSNLSFFYSFKLHIKYDSYPSVLL